MICALVSWSCLSEIKLNSNLIQFLFWLHFSVNVWLAAAGEWQRINKIFLTESKNGFVYFQHFDET